MKRPNVPMSTMGILIILLILVKFSSVPRSKRECRCDPDTCVCIQDQCYDKIAPIRDGPDWGSSTRPGHEELTIGDFIRGPKLGRGGFGDVWLARRKCAEGESDDDDGSDFVIKEVFQEPEWEREVWFANKLKGEPFIARYVSSGRVAGKLLIAFRYEGESLYKRMHSHSSTGLVTWEPIPLSDRLSVMRQLVHALQVLKRHNVVHRDIKPENLVVSGNGQLRIIDFGSSVQVGSSMTIFHRDGETEDYAPPQAWEELRSGRCFTTAYDMWSAGMVFLELYGARECKELSSRQKLLVMRNKANACLSRLQELLNICVDFRVVPEGSLGILEDVRNVKLEVPCPENDHAKRFNKCARESMAEEIGNAVHGMLRFDDTARLTPQEALAILENYNDPGTA